MKSKRPLASLRSSLLRGSNRAHVKFVLAICLMFGVLIVAGAYSVKDPKALFRQVAGWGSGESSGTAEPAGKKAAAVTGAESLGPNDPVVRFADTGVGHVLYAATSTNNCRRLLFDNRTGSYYEVPELFCGQVVEQAQDDLSDRMTAVRKSFRK
ncbi:MAG: hypothetical protein NTV56_18210 [Alphaproteobacteria bacterium]|nr:hypothetical protein [Alphaproteobacteria bacterium]